MAYDNDSWTYKNYIPFFYFDIYVFFAKARYYLINVLNDLKTKKINSIIKLSDILGRPGVTWVAVVITDGKSINMSETLKQSNIARTIGINMLAVGIGDARDVFRFRFIYLLAQ